MSITSGLEVHALVLLILSYSLILLNISVMSSRISPKILLTASALSLISFTSRLIIVFAISLSAFLLAFSSNCKYLQARYISVSVELGHLLSSQQ